MQAWFCVKCFACVNETPKSIFMHGSGMQLLDAIQGQNLIKTFMKLTVTKVAIDMSSGS